MKERTVYWGLGLLLAGATIASTWIQTRAVVLRIDNRGISVLTNVTVLVTGKAYRVGDIAPHEHCSVTVWPAADQKMQLRHQFQSIDLDHVDLGMPSLFGSASTVVSTHGYAFELTWHRILHGSIF